jgi:diguanylate cyclase (GGDEF)-like protein
MGPEKPGNNSTENGLRQAVDDPAVRPIGLGDDSEPFQYATVMMIDDEPVFIDVVQTFLEVNGYQKFVKVVELDEAVDRVREHRPDLLLLGVNAYQGPCFAILSTLRADPDFSDLPIVVVTSSTDTTTKSEALSLGATDFLSKPVDPSELALRVRNTLAARAYRDQLAYYDELTGLPSRHLFHDRVDSAIAQAQRERAKLGLLHITFDDFAGVAGTLGPRAGDEVLKQLARLLTSKLRASDSISINTCDEENGAQVFRLRKAEFSVLLPAVKSLTGIAAVGQRLLAAASMALSVGGNEVRLKPSIGISGFPEDAEDAPTLIKLAMGASRMAAAQSSGRLQFSSSAMNQAGRQWLQLRADLRRAVDAGELRLLYQPKVDVSKGAVVGAEALMRWPRSDGVCISPSDFISVAEETDMILPIGEWTLREACRQVTQWRDQGMGITVAVNVSRQQFFQADLAGLVRSVLEETGLAPAMLTLEITECILLDQEKRALAILDDLRAIGVAISIDDFGTGASSLGFFKTFQVDEIKIDRTLVSGVVKSSQDRALTYAISNVAHQFGAKVCAEGVEEARQLEFLRKIKCDRYQGYLSGRPLDPRSFVAHYRTQATKVATEKL